MREPHYNDNKYQQLDGYTNWGEYERDMSAYHGVDYKVPTHPHATIATMIVAGPWILLGAWVMGWTDPIVNFFTTMHRIGDAVYWWLIDSPVVLGVLVAVSLAIVPVWILKCLIESSKQERWEALGILFVIGCITVLSCAFVWWAMP
jgi:hypothetical protein